MRKSMLGVLRVLIAVLTCASAHAQTYPAKPVRMLFGFTAGGAGDVSARIQTGTPEQFAAFIRSERAQNVRLVKFAGIKIE